MDRTRYHVMPHDQGWQVSFEKSERASIVKTTKDAAIKEAISFAKNSGPSQVVIHGTYGNVMEEKTYPRASDPVLTKR